MYKISQFTTMIPYSDKQLLYNSLSDEFLLVEPMLKELLIAAKNEDNIGGIEDYHPSFFKYLQEYQFVVSSDLDEVDIIRKKSHEVDTNKKSYTLTINPTMGCNFKCWYCYETHINGSKMQDGHISNIGKFITNELKTNPELETFDISFFGGEPLIYYKQVVKPILELSKSIFANSEVHHHASFTTNGFLINQEMIDFFKNHNVVHFQITLDGSEEFHDKVRYVTSDRGSYKEIVENIKLLCKNELSVTLRINYTSENYLSCLEIPDHFNDLPDEAKQYLTVSMHQVWQDEKNDVSVIPIIQKFLDYGISIQDKATNLNNVEQSCYADKIKSMVVNYNGDVYKCTARDFTQENRLGWLNEDGSVHWLPEAKVRENAKFHNPPCFECKILPLCNGGCSQHAFDNIENDDGYCVFGFDENKKDDIILGRFRRRTRHLN